MRALILLCFLFSTVHVMAQDKPRKPWQLYEAAEASVSEGKYQEALALLDECLKLNPGYWEAYPLRGSVREQLKDLDGSLTDYSIFLEQFPTHPEVLMSRGVLRYQKGFLDQARDDFRQLLALGNSATTSVFYKQNMSVDDRNPIMTTSQHAHSPYVYNYLGLIEYKTKNAPQSIVYFDTAIYLENKEPDFYVNRGLAKELLNDSTSYLDYQRALNLNPNHTLAQHNLNVYFERRKQSMSVEERLTQTIEADSTMLYPYLERAQQRFEAGYFEGALDDYNQAAELSPNSFEILFARGLTKEKLKEYDEAFSDYTKAIELKESYPKAWLSRGNVLLKMDRYNDAIEDYNVALVYQPDYSLAFYNRGMAYVKLKKNAEACADFKKAEDLGMKIDEKLRSKICK